MLLEENGLIVIVSSDAAESAYPEWGPYGASKAAADHLFSIWQEELRSHSIRFFALDPGDMNTVMHRDALPDADTGDLQNPSTVAKKMVTFLSRPPATDRVRYDSASWQDIADREAT